MSDACSCSVVFGNTGVPGCVPIAKVAKKLIIVPYYGSGGTRNGINLSSDTLNQTFIDGKINASDKNDRWYPTPYLENVEDVRGDTTYEEFNSGKRKKIKQGTRTFNSLIDEKTPELLEELQKAGCTQFGAYVVDADGNLIGNGGTSGYLYPIRIDASTWDVKLQKATDSTAQHLMLEFDWHHKEYDKDIRMLVYGDMSFDALSLQGLIDLYGTVSNISTTGFTMAVYSKYGSVSTPVAIEDLASSDFEIYNVTDSASTTISTMTESPEGTYAFTFSAETSADVLSLRIASATNGYDDTSLRAVTITIP